VVPPRGLAISLAAFVVAVLGAVFFRDTAAEYSFLMWLLAMMPAFALCHYRGWSRIKLVLGVSMVFITVGYVVTQLAGWRVSDWPAFVFVLAAYIGLALGWGWLAEVRNATTERQVAEEELQRTHQDLRESHANLKLAQWKLLEAEKLETVGQLAAGVAHEVKNPLMTLLTGVRYMQQQSQPNNPELETLLDDMRDARRDHSYREPRRGWCTGHYSV